MYNRIDAVPFTPSLEIYEKEFENILIGITVCYHIMLKDNVTMPNDENKIRDTLRNNYLNNRQIRDQIGFTGKYNVDREVPEDNDMGRVDIKIITQNTLTEPEAYYIIECKRLDNQNLTGVSGLNAKYITDGIKRFILSGKDIKQPIYISETDIENLITAKAAVYAAIKILLKRLEFDFSII